MTSRTRPVPMLTGLSLEDRQLMLEMMAALGSAAQTMMKASQTLAGVAELTVTAAGEAYEDEAKELDDEANTIIDICKKAKDRLKPGHSVIVN